MRGRRRWMGVLLGLVVLAGAGIAVVLATRDSGAERDRGEQAHEGRFGDNPRQEMRNEGRERRAVPEVRGSKGGEARRGGPRSPAAEAVAQRAYPRAYVDDRRALATRRAFGRVGAHAGPGDFRTRSAYRAATRAAPQRSWLALGPTTPLVAKEATQTYDPNTGVGTPTTNSGRVTAIAVDPACSPASCRVWIGAAGGGVWRTSNGLAAKPTWTPPGASLPSNAIGALYYDAPRNTLYAGTGEPNGSGDSEAGLGLYRSTDGGASWSAVPGSVPVATNRSISSIQIDPSNPKTMYIGTALARHGLSSVQGGRRTPPGAPALGVYKSTDGGQSFTLLTDLATKTPADPTPPDTGVDFFTGGIYKLELDPTTPSTLYASVAGYGLWRSQDAGATWKNIFRTENQSGFDADGNPTGDSTGDRSEFDAVATPQGTRIYLGDSSDDFALDDDPATPGAEFWRIGDAQAIVGVDQRTDPLDNAAAGWDKLSSPENGTPGFLAQDFCQNGQCNYDQFVASPPGHPDTVWLGGSFNYDELPAYGGLPPRSNGRAVIRSTNAGDFRDTVTWQDMTQDAQPPGQRETLHPDQHAIAFAQGGNIAFVGQDGGVMRVDVTTTKDISGECSGRTYAYDADPEPLRPPDLLDCLRLLSAVPQKLQSLDDGLNTLQFQSLSVSPTNPRRALGGTQDNGTWAFTGTPTWTETVGGDGGQSGFDEAQPVVRYHNYFNATPEVNFHGNDPKTWLDIYDVLQASNEQQSFYTPFTPDPIVGGRAYTGLESVWRTDDNGGAEADLVKNGCNALSLNPDRDPCGDWVRVGANLTSDAFGSDRDGDFVAAVEPSTDPNTVWAATRTGRLFVTSNADDVPGSVSWRRIDTDQTPGRFVSGIAVDPFDPDHAFITYSGYDAYTPDTPGHVFEVTYDPGKRVASFVDRSYDLGDQPITDVAYNEPTGDLYASTDFGVLRLPRGSRSWVRAGTGLPPVAVYGLTLTGDGRGLYAATHGRGAYALALPARPSVRIAGPGRVEVGTRARYSATAKGNGPFSFRWAVPGHPPAPRGAHIAFVATRLGLRFVKVQVTDADGTVTLAGKRVRIVDTRRPRVTAAVGGQGRRLHFSGNVVDAGGIARVRISFGDGTARVLRPGRGGAVAARHTYRRAGSYTVRLEATDRSGHRAVAVERVRAGR